jgi:amidase
MKRLTREHLVPDGQRYKVFEPVMTVEPGETILVETINHMTPIVETEADLHAHGSPEYRERLETGPIYVNGAEPGDMLAITIEQIEPVGLPHAHGWGPLHDRETGAYKQEPMAYPVEDGAVTFPGGLRVPLATMVGDIYTTPGETRQHFDHGGNMDFTEIKPGNTLYLPVYHDGGLLVLGDVHAAQGDGEVFGEGAETAADVTVTIDIDRRLHGERPIVETPDSWVCLACRGPLFDSLTQALDDSVALFSRLHDTSPADAYVFCATVGSVRFGGTLFRRELAEGSCLVGFSVPKEVG